MSPFSHSNKTDICRNCHNNVIATGKSSGHPLTTNNCEFCHLAGGSWFSIATPFQGEPCVNCHTKNGSHPPTTNICEVCHVTNNWRQISMDHSQVPSTARCDSCHTNGGVATPKSNNHCATTADCRDCYSPGGGWGTFNDCAPPPAPPPQPPMMPPGGIGGGHGGGGRGGGGGGMMM